MTETIIQKLTLKTRLGYGIGDIAICLYWSGVGLYLLYFYTDVVGISPSMAGLIYGIGMLWDALTDPFMGYIAERTRTKWGVYRPYLLFGNLPLALSFILLFWVPPFEGSMLFFFLLFTNLLHRTCFTLVSVPFYSLTPRITSDSQERTNLTGFRMMGAQTGTNLMALLAFPIIFWVGGENESFGSDSGNRHGSLPTKKYAENLTSLIKKVRLHYKVDDLPFLMLGVGSNKVISKMKETSLNLSNVTLIERSLKSNAQNYTPRYTHDWNGKPANHYNYSGMKKIGQLFFENYSKFYGNYIK